MDLHKAISELYAQRDRLVTAIAKLEALNGNSTAIARSTRGRKSMGEAERREVSARMKKYWAKRRRA